jgi:hypothetical protein
VEGGHGHEPIFDPQARTAGGPAWRHLNPETGTQKGFLAEQKASLAPGTAKSLGDHPRRGSGIPHDAFLDRGLQINFRIADVQGVVAWWLESKCRVVKKLAAAPSWRQAMFETCDNRGERIPAMVVRSGQLERTEKTIRSPRSLKKLAFGIALSCCSITRLFAQSSAAGVEHTDSLKAPQRA